MAVKKGGTTAKTSQPAPTPLDVGTHDDSETARNVWFAGLGALAKAQAEGSKAFEALVSEGIAMQRKTQAMAREQLAEAAQRIEELTAGASSAATGRWDKLEGIFEDRVARAMARLGFPQAEELARLSARLDALEQRLDQATTPSATRAAEAGSGSAPAAPARRRPAKAPARKKS